MASSSVNQAGNDVFPQTATTKVKPDWPLRRFCHLRQGNLTAIRISGALGALHSRSRATPNAAGVATALHSIS